MDAAAHFAAVEHTLRALAHAACIEDGDFVPADSAHMRHAERLAATLPPLASFERGNGVVVIRRIF